MVQQKLQRELDEALGNDDDPVSTFEQVKRLPYLEAVVRETLRVHAVLTSTLRVAVADDLIPLGTPLVDRRGRTVTEIACAPGSR